ncbi:MAG: hypoxanthine phosphoribosyltransferase [Chloroflexi bacterium 44-23]|nr:MAG: hypoxanthine phosphoribosyltransferase [Chloroflexi bacterium 44-23]
MADIKEVIFTAEQIQEKVDFLGKQISFDYQDKTPIFIGILKGVFIFMADLLRSITIDCQVDFLAISNYSSHARSQGEVRLVKDLDLPIRDRHVVFVEDVIDTGLTLNYLLKNLQERKPKSLEVCVLFNKPAHRLIEIPARYCGYDLPDRFVVGYGLDHNEKYRNLDFVGLLKAEKIHSS